MTQVQSDFAIIGGGIIGLAAARQLRQRFPAATITLLEKENTLASHQSGHNSGVIHAGVYYEPGSLKARLCRSGLEYTYEFCAEHDIPVERCGKLIVASTDSEVARLTALYQRGKANGAALSWLNTSALKDLCGSVNGVAAIASPATGSVDFRTVACKLGELLQRDGVEILTSAPVIGWENTAGVVTLSIPGRSLRARFVVACAGLHADRIARLAGLAPDFAILPFRGEYFVLPRIWHECLPHHIYPVPDPALPFLGIHLTRTIDGRVLAGPNAVLAAGREAYRWRDIDPGDCLASLAFPGTWKLLRKHWLAGLGELRTSVMRRAYLAALNRYVPAVALADLAERHAGVRAQAVARDGRLIDDFLLLDGPNSLHVCNAPSPAATSAFPIGACIADAVASRSGLKHK